MCSLDSEVGVVDGIVYLTLYLHVTLLGIV
jgi:hypothetical protein